MCTPKSRIIWGEGNPKSSVVIILDNPGAREDKDGNEYVCGTRATLQTALNNVGLSQNEVYITYLLKCRPLRKYDKAAAYNFSKPFLVKQIFDISPKFLVCLGDTVVKYMFDDADASVKDMRGKWHRLMGADTIVSYHPLAVRRRPNLSKNFEFDFQMLIQRFNSEKADK